nr:hemoglobin subunit theta-1-like [Vulpes vulpes]
MALSGEDRAAVRALWRKLGGNVGIYATKQYRLLSHCLLVTLARHYPGDLGPAMHASLHKFLSHVTSALASRCG